MTDRRPDKQLSERVSAALASASKSGTATGSAPTAEQPRVAPASRPPAQASPRPPSSSTAPAKPESTSPVTAPKSSGKPRTARLRLTHLDPWSVMRTSFLLAVAIGVVTVVAVFVVWSVLGVAGVWDSINDTVLDVVGTGNGSTFDITDYLGMDRVMGFTIIVAVVDVVLITAIATLGAFLYNLAAALLGGIEVTLAEDRD